VFIPQATHHGVLSRIKATSRDIEDIYLWKTYFNDGTMIPEAEGEIIIRPPPVGPYQMIVVCCDVYFC
jgi:hypothetical protein